jgi:hypothetical protein
VLKARRRSNDATDQDASAPKFPSNDVKRDVLFRLSATQPPSTRQTNPRPPNALSVKGLKRDGEKAFCARQKISFHHTPKTRGRQPRARRNNATFSTKILAFSTKPSVSVVFLSKIALRRSIRRLFNAANVRKTQTDL